MARAFLRSCSQIAFPGSRQWIFSSSFKAMNDPQFREATLHDIPAMFRIRVAVRENAMNEDDLRGAGITPESASQRLQTCCKGWVAVYDGQVVGFSVADSGKSSIWALFVYPQFEGRGLGRRLLDAAVAWLWEKGAERIWLTTEPDTRADGFYRHLGWQRGEKTGTDEVCYTMGRR